MFFLNGDLLEKWLSSMNKQSLVIAVGFIKIDFLHIVSIEIRKLWHSLLSNRISNCL